MQPDKNIIVEIRLGSHGTKDVSTEWVTMWHQQTARL